MGSGYSKMKKQAKLLQEKMASARDELKSKMVTGISGNGLVSVEMNGEKELKKISIKPECVDVSDLEGLQDLILAACAHAHEQLKAEDELPGLSLDFF